MNCDRLNEQNQTELLKYRKEMEDLVEQCKIDHTREMDELSKKLQKNDSFKEITNSNNI